MKELNAPKEVSWEEVVSDAKDGRSVEMNSMSLPIFYIHQATGTPKGIVRDIGSIVALKWTIKISITLIQMTFGGLRATLVGLLDTLILSTLLYLKDALQFV